MVELDIRRHCYAYALEHLYIVALKFNHIIIRVCKLSMFDNSFIIRHIKCDCFKLEVV